MPHECQHHHDPAAYHHFQDTARVPHDRHHFSRPDQVKQPLYVVTTVFNPIRWRSRWKLYDDFVRMVEQSGAVLYTVEVAFGDREFAVTSHDNPRHLQLRTSQELWIKENSLNLMIQRLPADWQYVAWVDADVHFVRPDWANETIHQLQHYDFVQMWSEAHDLKANHELMTTHNSFVWCWQRKLQDFYPKETGYYGAKPGQKKYYWHPGYAWAARRSALEAVGGLIDWGILGGGDLYMARLLTGISRVLPKSLGPTGQAWLKTWGERADRCIRKNVGVVEGGLFHYWHGPKAQRGYQDRGQILVSGKFDPAAHLRRDTQGLWMLDDLAVELRDGIRSYFRQRNEDQV